MKHLQLRNWKILTKILTITILHCVCEFPQDCNSIWQVIKYADVALYNAKEGGRQVVRFTEEKWTGKQF